MSTRNTAIIFANDSDAHFRAWAQEVHDALAAFGWVNTADTGQINLVTVVAPVSTSVVKGYEIWRMADALQSLYPVYMKIEYGSGPSAATQFGLWITVGTSTNGAGTMGGQSSTRTTFYGPSSPDTTSRNCVSSGSTNRFCVGFNADGAAGNSYAYFGVERSQDSTGADSNEGMFVFMASQQNSSVAGFVTHQFVPFTGSIPVLETYATGDVPTSAQSSGVFGSDVNTYAVKPAGFYPRNPIRNWLVYYNTDFTSGTPITLSIYGGTSTYFPCGNVSSGNTFLSQRGNTAVRLLMRYE